WIREVTRQFADRLRVVIGVRIRKDQNRSGRELENSAQRVNLSVPLLQDHRLQTVALILAKNVTGRICRPVRNKQELQFVRRVVKGETVLNLLLDNGFLVESRDQQGN